KSWTFQMCVAWFVIIKNIMFLYFFFFQAEHGIRDKLVTGVQTCALPISAVFFTPNLSIKRSFIASTVLGLISSFWAISWAVYSIQIYRSTFFRSEERRVGKECRFWWSPDHEKKKSHVHGHRWVRPDMSRGTIKTEEKRQKAATKIRGSAASDD